MTEHLLVGTAAFIVVVTMWKSLLRAVLQPTPGGAVLVSSSLYLVGAAVTEWRQGTADAMLVFVTSVVCFTSYAVAYFTVSSGFRLERAPRDTVSGLGGAELGSPGSKWLFLITMILLVGASVYATGTDQLVVALYQFVVSGDTDVSVGAMRLDFSSGSTRWMAPGYAMQLRDVLMPLSVLLVLFAIRRRPFRFLIVAWTVIPLAALLMISSGQRGPILLLFVGALYAARRTMTKGILAARSVAVFVVLALAIGGGTFYALTSSFTTRDQSDGTSIVPVLVDRIVTRLPEENVFSASIWKHGAPFVGAGWLSEIGSILPGTQQTLSNQLHEELGGGDKGNSPLGLWVDVFYNYGWWLCVPVSLMLGVAIAAFNHWVNTARSRSHIADICGTWLSVTMLSVVSPFTFILYGPFVLSIVLFISSTRLSSHRETGVGLARVDCKP